VIARRREGGLALAARGLAGLMVLSIILVQAIQPRWMTWASFDPPDWVPWAGAALGLLTVPMVYWVFSSLGRNVSETVLTKQRHELVTTGPYRWVRHPLYATGIALLVAIGLMTTSWLILLFAFLAFVLFLFLVVPVEEHQLLGKFGDAYRAYMRRTGRFFPRIRPVPESLPQPTSGERRRVGS
jgi:protein-S-isoprenylcysteine O-methyltransferase Ste14